MSEHSAHRRHVWGAHRYDEHGIEPSTGVGVKTEHGVCERYLDHVSEDIDAQTGDDDRRDADPASTGLDRLKTGETDYGYERCKPGD